MQRRVSLEPAWILHRRPYRDSSMLLDVLTQNHGRISLVARGQRKGRLAGELQALQPLRIDFVRRGDLGTLGRFESSAAALRLQGMALWSAFYVNELLVRLVGQDAEHPQTLFELYGRTLSGLMGPSVAPVLRQFEYQLLSGLGYALDRDLVEAAAGPFAWDPLRGLIPVHHGVSQQALLALIDGAEDERVLGSKHLLADMLRMLLGHKPLQSASMLRDLVALKQQNRQATQ